MGKILIFFGVLLVVIGLLWTYQISIPWLGKLPGDIWIERENFQLYLPITTSIIISIILSLIFYLFSK